MFDSIMYTRASYDSARMDLGLLAESLLFYRKVVVYGNESTLRDIFRRVPPLLFVELIAEGRLSLNFRAHTNAVQSVDVIGGRKVYQPVRVAVAAAPADMIEKAFFQVAGRTGDSRLAVRRLVDATSFVDDTHLATSLFIDAVRSKDFLRNYIQKMVEHIAPEYRQNDPIIAEATWEGDWFYFDTNIDLEQLKRYVPAEKDPNTFGPASMLASLHSTFESSEHAASISAALVASDEESVAQAVVVKNVVDKALKDKENIEAFLNVTLDDALALREGVNSGRIPFSKILRLLESADEFREWLNKVPEDASILKEYMRAVTKPKWTSDLPTKLYRWSMFVAAGELASVYTGPGAYSLSLGLGLFDTFILERLHTGWSPDQFIQNKLVPLVHPAKASR